MRRSVRIMGIGGLLDGVKVWTERELDISETEYFSHVLKEYEQLLGGEVKRRWALNSIYKEKDKVIGIELLTDREVKEMFDIELPESSWRAGKTKEELILEASEK